MATVPFPNRLVSFKESAPLHYIKARIDNNENNDIALFFYKPAFYYVLVYFFCRNGLPPRFAHWRARVTFSAFLVFIFGISWWFYWGLKKSLWKTIKNFWSKIDFKILIKNFRKFSENRKISIFQIFRFFENFQWKSWFFRFFDFSKNFENFKFSMKIQWKFWFSRISKLSRSKFWNQFSAKSFGLFS